MSDSSVSSNPVTTASQPVSRCHVAKVLELAVVVVFLERWNSKEAQLRASSRVGVSRGLGTTLSPPHNGTPWPVYTGIGRDLDVSEVRPHPALCPAHVTVVRVVIRVNVCPMNPSSSVETWITRVSASVLVTSCDNGTGTEVPVVGLHSIQTLFKKRLERTFGRLWQLWTWCSLPWRGERPFSPRWFLWKLYKQLNDFN